MNQQSNQHHVSNLVSKSTTTSPEAYANYTEDRFVTVFKTFVLFCQRKKLEYTYKSNQTVGHFNILGLFKVIF